MLPGEEEHQPRLAMVRPRRGEERMDLPIRDLEANMRQTTGLPIPEVEQEELMEPMDPAGPGVAE